MLYRNLPEFLKTEEKAFLFLTWPQMFLVLAGVLVGGIISGQVATGPLTNMLLTVGCALIGLALGVIRLDQVPLYQIIVALVRYWVDRIRTGRPPTVQAADLWPAAEADQWQALWIQASGAPIIQIEEQD